MLNMRNLDDLLAPVSAEEFLGKYLDKRPLHIPGDPKKFEGVMDFKILERLLNMTAIWSSSSLELAIDRQRIPPQAYCTNAKNRDGVEVLQPDAGKVMDQLRLGASLVANDIDSLTPDVARIAEILEQGLNVKAQANLYYSWKQRQAFTSHFDTHDVFAVHLVGEKTWRVYKNRMPHPIRHASFGLDESYQEANRGDILEEITLTPGDLLYLPRGQFHDALASSEGTIHIAFGATGVIGLDFIGAMTDMVVGSELYRTNFPRPDAGRDALKRHVKALAAELGRIAESDEFLTRFEDFQRNFHYRRGGVSIPATGQDQAYELTGPDYNVAAFRNGLGLFGPKGVVPIPGDRGVIVKWMVDRKRFTIDQLLDAFAEQSAMTLNETVIEVCRMGILRPAKS